MLKFRQMEKKMKKYFDILRKCPLFEEIEEENLIPLLHCLGVKVVKCGKKETILADGAPAVNMGIMLSGAAQVSQIDYNGNRHIISGIEPAEMFAEAFACAGVSNMPVDIIANQDCEVMLIDSNRVMHSCSNACGFHRQMIFNLMKDLAVKNVFFHQKMEITSQRSTREKLMAFLTFQAKKAGSRSFDIEFDRQELADYLQVDRTGLSTEIGKLKKEGIIENHRKHFELLEK